MKRILTPFFCIALMLFATSVLHGQADNGKPNAFSASENAAEIKLLLEKFGNSLVTVSYYFKLDEETGLMPQYRVRYLCPNCSNYHDGSISELMEKNLPVTAAGFYLGDSVVVTQNLGLRMAWIDHIEINTATGGRLKASIAAFCDDENAVKLVLEKSDVALPALQFSAKTTLPAKAFYIANENYVRIGGLRRLSEADVKYSLDAGKAFYSCPVNTLLLDEQNAPVTLLFTEQRDIDKPIAAPFDWHWTDIVEYDKSIDDFNADIASSFYPVTVTLNSTREKSNSGMAMVFRSDNDGENNEFNCIAYLMEDGNLMAPLLLEPSQTARFDRATVVTKEGKTIKAAFIGSLRKYGIIILKPEAPLPLGKVQLGNENTLASAMLDNVIACSLTNNGTYITAQGIKTRILPANSDFEENITRLAHLPSADTYVFTKDMKLCIAPVQRRTIDANDYYARKPEARKINDITKVLNSASPFDANNAPKAKDEQTKQIVDFGAEFQKLTKQMVKAKKLERFFDMTDYELGGALVTHVRQGTIAAKIGIQQNDILLYTRPADEFSHASVKFDDMNLFGDEFPWEEYDQLPEELFDQVPQPWGSVSNAFNHSLEKIGIGNDAIVAYIRDGKFHEAHFTIVAADNCFESAPRHKSKTIGLTIAPLTPEVREYFKLKDDAPGVVIAAVRNGSPASKAGLKPFEIITSINGTDVHSIDEFKELTNTSEGISLSVRRLVKSRVVKVTPAE